MAVALLGSPASNTPGATSIDANVPYTAFSYAVSAGSNRLLVLFIGIGSNTNLNGGSTVLYGAQAMTQIPSYKKTDTNFVMTQAFYLLEAGIAAAIGTTVSFLGDGSANTIDDLILGAAAFSDVHQTTPFGGSSATVGTNTSTAPSTGSITCPANGLVIGSVATDDDNAFSEASTLLFEVEGLSSDFGCGAQYRTSTGALVWTTDSQAWATAGIPLTPTGGGGGGRTTKNTRASNLGMELGMEMWGDL